MAETYQKKFYFTFKDINNQQFTVEIHQLALSGTVTATEVKPAENSFIVSMPGLGSKFEAVRGSGCQINLVSESNMQFVDLFTANMFEFMIKAYKGVNLIWCGYLDSELYTEPFNELINYDVSFSGSDGFALLDRLNYVQSDGSKFSGIVSQFDVIKYILEKINLPINNTLVYLSTSISGVTITEGKTVLNATYVSNSNFYNEDNEPEALRTVLESILRPYGAFILQDNGNIYITDVQQLATASLGVMQRYTGNLGTYLNDNGVAANIGDLSDIGFANSSQNLTIVSGYNKEIINYSPYRQTAIIDYDASEDFKNNSGIGTTKGAINYQWTEYDYITSANSSYWNKLNNGKFCSMIGIDGENINEKDSYLKINNNGSQSQSLEHFNFKASIPTLYKSNGYKLKVSLSGYFRLTDDLNNPLTTATEVTQGILYTELKIGNKKYVNNTLGYQGVWVDLTSTEYFRLFFNNQPVGVYNNIIYSPLENQWIEAASYSFYDFDKVKKNEYLLPLDSISGELSFSIRQYKAKKNYTTYVNCLDARFKDIKFTIVDKNGNEVANLDNEFIGYMNKNYKNEGDSITLLLGTNEKDFPTERGALKFYNGTDYLNIKNWVKAGTTDNIENLLLRSYVGNYENKTIEISATTNMLPSSIGYLTYNNYLSGKKFMLTSIENSFAECTSNFTMQEIFVDALEINRLF